jgi:hypothetical protein
MKLFFLLIPFLGIQCITSAWCQEKRQSPSVEKKEIVAYQILPGNLLLQFN